MQEILQTSIPPTGKQLSTVEGTFGELFGSGFRLVSAAMSRHKIVKNLDLDDELDDFDGGEDYEDGGDGEDSC